MTSSIITATNGIALSGDANERGSWQHRVFRCAKPLWLATSVLLLFLALWCPRGLNAAPGSPQRSRVSHRHLLVVETSRAMQRRAGNTQEAIQNLLHSGLQGQLQDGDTLGLWTFNGELHTGEFPLQNWSTATRLEIATRVRGFLRAKTNDGPAKIEQALGAIQKLIANSEFLTVLLVTSGEQPISGTPFDNQINEVYRLWTAEQQRTQMPFIAVLGACRGKVTDFAVSPAPWPVEMPALPRELMAPKIVRAKPALGAPKATEPPPASSRALIYSGSNPEPRTNDVQGPRAKQVEPAPLHGASATTPIAMHLESRNIPDATSLTIEARSAITPPPGPQSPNQGKTESASLAADSEPVLSEETATAEAQAQSATDKSLSELTDASVSSELTVSVDLPKPSVVNAVTPEPAPKAEEPTPESHTASTSEAVTPSLSNFTTSNSAPAREGTPIQRSAESITARSQNVELSSTASNSVSKTASTPDQKPVKVTVAQPSLAPGIVDLRTIALVVGAAAFAGLTFLVRRPRPRTHTSLITRSLDRR